MSPSFGDHRVERTFKLIKLIYNFVQLQREKFTPQKYIGEHRLRPSEYQINFRNYIENDLAP